MRSKDRALHYSELRGKNWVVRGRCEQRKLKKLRMKTDEDKQLEKLQEAQLLL